MIYVRCLLPFRRMCVCARTCIRAYIHTHTLQLKTRFGSHPTTNLEPPQVSVDELRQIDAGRPHHIALHFIALPRCWIFKKIEDKTLYQQKDYNSLFLWYLPLLYSDACFIVVLWTRTYIFSRVCLFSGGETVPSYTHWINLSVIATHTGPLLLHPGALRMSTVTFRFVSNSP